ncbi:MAG TPA: hypothetical protein VF158_05250 [Longimicrobiales bacterium]
MGDFLSALAERALGVAATAAPRLTPGFAPLPDPEPAEPLAVAGWDDDAEARVSGAPAPAGGGAVAAGDGRRAGRSQREPSREALVRGAPAGATEAARRAAPVDPERGRAAAPAGRGAAVGAPATGRTPDAGAADDDALLMPVPDGAAPARDGAGAAGPVPGRSAPRPAGGGAAAAGGGARAAEESVAAPGVRPSGGPRPAALRAELRAAPDAADAGDGAGEPGERHTGRLRASRRSAASRGVYEPLGDVGAVDPAEAFGETRIGEAEAEPSGERRAGGRRAGHGAEVEPHPAAVPERPAVPTAARYAEDRSAAPAARPGASVRPLAAQPSAAPVVYPVAVAVGPGERAMDARDRAAAAGAAPRPVHITIGRIEVRAVLPPEPAPPAAAPAWTAPVLSLDEYLGRTRGRS